MALQIPTLLSSTVSTSSILTLTSGSFTPTANSLLLVVLSTLSADSGQVRNHDSCTSTITGQGSFTERVDLLQDVTNREEEISIYTSQTGSSPNSGTVTMNWLNAASTRTVMLVYEVTGHNITTPIGVTGSNSGSGNTLTVTLSGTPVSTSMVFAAVVCTSGTSDPGITEGSGFTEITAIDSGGNTVRNWTEVMYDLVGADNTADWSSLDTVNNVGVAIEINEATSGGRFLKLLGVGK